MPKTYLSFGSQSSTARHEGDVEAAEPDVLWRANGIGALFWADAEPYADILSPATPPNKATPAVPITS